MSELELEDDGDDEDLDLDHNDGMEEVDARKADVEFIEYRKPNPSRRRTIENATCCICFGELTNAGSHQVVSLQCGHIFGSSCIREWLRRPPRGQGYCPQCKRPARESHIRPIFTDTLTIIDRSVEEEWKRKAIQAESHASRLERELSLREFRIKFLEDRASRMEKELISLRSRKVSGSSFNGFEPNESFIDAPIPLEEASSVESKQQDFRCPFRLEWEIQRENIDLRCIAMTDSSSGSMILHSHGPRQSSSTSSLPHTYGYSMVPLFEPTVSRRVLIHSGSVRDISPSHKDPHLVLCASMDRDISISDLRSQSAVARYTNAYPPWSCVWQNTDSHSFFAGFVNGVVSRFDLRSLSSAVESFSGLQSPVHSLSIHNSWIIAGSLSSVSAFHIEEKSYVPSTCAGGSVSVSSYQDTVLISSRKHRDFSRSAHTMWHFDDQTWNLERVIDGFSNETILAKSLIFCVEQDVSQPVFVASGDEGDNSLVIWDQSGAEVQRLKSRQDHRKPSTIACSGRIPRDSLPPSTTSLAACSHPPCLPPPNPTPSLASTSKHIPAPPVSMTYSSPDSVLTACWASGISVFRWSGNDDNNDS